MLTWLLYNAQVNRMFCALCLKRTVEVVGFFGNTFTTGSRDFQLRAIRLHRERHHEAAMPGVSFNDFASRRRAMTMWCDLLHLLSVRRSN